MVVQRTLLDQVMREFGVTDPLLWYYTPQALMFSDHLDGRAVYDCMDELSAFAGADPALPNLERRLMQRASLVFTGGQSLYEAKRDRHPDVHAFPSGVDVDHFLPARGALPDPADQAGDPPSPHGLLRRFGRAAGPCAAGGGRGPAPRHALRPGRADRED